MTAAATVRGLGVRYGSTVALDGVDLDLHPGVIHGLFGRNGSGKTSLLSVLASYRRASAGTVLVDGRDPFEDAVSMARTCLVRDDSDTPDEKVRDVLRFTAAGRETWDAELADRLVDRFELPLRRKPSQLSRGKRSALGVVIGLASRAPLTMFDEAYLGLDAPSRYAFHEELLADYAAHPRTIVLSSHLISEVEALVERVVVLDRGRVVVDEEADTLRARGLTVTGPEAAVEELLTGHRVLARQRLGRTLAATVLGDVDRATLDRAAASGLDLGPVPLQDLVVHLTAHEERS